MTKPREWWVLRWAEDWLMDSEEEALNLFEDLEAKEIVHVIEKYYADALETERDEYVHEAEHFQHKAIDLDQANGMLKAELNKKEFELAESAIALNEARAELKQANADAAENAQAVVSKHNMILKLETEIERLKNPFNPPEINYGKKVELAEIKLLSPDERLREYFAARTEADSFRNMAVNYRAKLLNLFETWDSLGPIKDDDFGEMNEAIKEASSALKGDEKK